MPERLIGGVLISRIDVPRLLYPCLATPISRIDVARLLYPCLANPNPHPTPTPNLTRWPACPCLMRLQTARCGSRTRPPPPALATSPRVARARSAGRLLRDRTEIAGRSLRDLAPMARAARFAARRRRMVRVRVRVRARVG